MSSVQGTKFEQMFLARVQELGWKCHGSSWVGGCQVDQMITKGDKRILIECKGSWRGKRPGLVRTDTLKKAICNAVLVKALRNEPFVVVTSHVPTEGVGRQMYDLALRLGILDAVVLYDDMHLYF